MSRLRYHLSLVIEITFFTLLATIMFTSLVTPMDRVPVSILWQQLAVGVAGSLSCLVYPWERGMSKKEAAVRSVIHYFIVMAMVLGLGSLFEWFDITDVVQTVIMMITITAIFVISSLISWKKSFDETDRLNAGLNKK